MSDPSEPSHTPEFPDVPAFVSVLNRHAVRYVVIGGYVAQGFVSDYVTHDVDFTPATDRENLDRLSAALRELGARIRTDAVTEGLPFAHDGGSLMRAKMWNLQCTFGAFDITFEPAGGDTTTSRHVRVSSPSEVSRFRWRIWPTLLLPKGWRTGSRISSSCLGSVRP